MSSCVPCVLRATFGANACGLTATVHSEMYSVSRVARPVVGSCVLPEPATAAAASLVKTHAWSAFWLTGMRVNVAD